MVQPSFSPTLLVCYHDETLSKGSSKRKGLLGLSFSHLGRNMEARNWSGDPREVFLIFSVAFYTAQAYLSKDATVDWAVPHQLLKQKVSRKYCHSQSDWSSHTMRLLFSRHCLMYVKFFKISQLKQQLLQSAAVCFALI